MSKNLNVYKSIDNTERIVPSLLHYLNYYSNTANKKTERIQALHNADAILDFVIAMLDDNTANSQILYAIFSKMINKVVKAKINQNTLYDFRDEIGFLKLLRDLESDKSSG